MAQDFTTTGLLASLKRRGMLPSTAETLSTADFLALATEELQTYVMKVLLAVREEYAVATYDLTLTAGTSSYLMPTRAIGGKLRNVALVDSSGLTTPLARLEPGLSSNTQGNPTGYSLQGDDVIFSPIPSAADTVRLTYFRRPSSLVATTAVGTITAINTGTKVVTCNVPVTFTTAVTYDFVRAQPPFKILGQDLAVTAVGGATVTFTATLPTGLAVGDYVTLAGESAVPQIPVELHPLLSQRVVYKCLEALGDDKSVLAEQASDKMRMDLLTLLTPRVEGASRPIVNYNGPGFRRRR